MQPVCCTQNAIKPSIITLSVVSLENDYQLHQIRKDPSEEGNSFCKGQSFSENFSVRQYLYFAEKNLCW